MKTCLITGGAGFIGSNLVHKCILETKNNIINIDKLTYAGNINSLAKIYSHPRHTFVHGSIGDNNLIGDLLNKYKPEAIINLAAESHVDRSIDGPKEFINTNIVDTFNFLEEVKKYWFKLDELSQNKFCMLHVSTDEVYGSLGEKGYFTEKSRYEPNSPYSASKAASDHLVRAYYKTYGIPAIITHSSNNFGPYQFPEKLLPLMIIKAISGEKMPIYGDGKNVRDWIYVQDHCDALIKILENGKPGEVYNIGGESEKSNIYVVQTICKILDEIYPNHNGESYQQQINFVDDRPGHDFRYAVDISKVKREIGWEPAETFEAGIMKTIKWYLDNKEWYRSIQDGSYKGERLGLKTE